MVHALSEALRVLTSGGVLLDARPLTSTCPLEIVTPAGAALRVGEIEATGDVADDLAADRAIHRAVVNGRLQRVREDFFEVDFYWNSVADMRAFTERSKRTAAVRPDYEELETLLARPRGGGGEPRLRSGRPTMLAVYRPTGR